MSTMMRAVRTINRAIAPLGVRLARTAVPSAAVDVAPPLPLPPGVGRAALLRSLFSLEMDRPPPHELRAYAEADCDRFVHTLGLVPNAPGAVLEIGANPYFTTILLKQFRTVDLHLTNYFSGPMTAATQDIVWQGVDGTRHRETLDYTNVNVEDDALPFADATFDIVLFCEVLEHMTNDPLLALTRIKRVIRPGGQLIVTTPNVARLENIARLLTGTNLYDPYSGYGPYGRHNREYTATELDRLLTHCGFTCEVLFTADVTAPVGDGLDVAAATSRPLRPDGAGYGQYLFSRWRNAGPVLAGRPAWLYRSYPVDTLV